MCFRASSPMSICLLMTFFSTTLFLLLQTIYAVLQLAISMVEEWSVSNFLSFKAVKCMSRRKNPIIPPHSLELFGSPMQSCYKYLGLLLTKNLTWSAHISSICSNAKKILGLIFRHFYSSSNHKTLKQLYVSLVRPHLEYTCQVWDPHLTKDKKN